MDKDNKKLLANHDKLVHSENRKVVSHVQRQDGEWFLNTIMLEGIDTPFKYKRKKAYQTLQGSRVNLTYYPDSEDIAGLQFEYMKVVRIRRS
ncbi:hypothetical protein E2K93_12800 [Thalassotalea sp. HSM 43]|uniref:hypothetical protein n=1 Tax=Thalassotalea sp. HSM 43 TaxID=2552945 RepID=UPI00108024A7|nr:hypothetical protein [Thalassotalea sp. HSM 43]QBY05205.1 hypothetical protein E2K93_12800 [Thalassotalea sp. HSM 43]